MRKKIDATTMNRRTRRLERDLDRGVDRRARARPASEQNAERPRSAILPADENLGVAVAIDLSDRHDLPEPAVGCALDQHLVATRRTEVEARLRFGVAERGSKVLRQSTDRHRNIDDSGFAARGRDGDDLHFGDSYRRDRRSAVEPNLGISVETRSADNHFRSSAQRAELRRVRDERKRWAAVAVSEDHVRATDVRLTGDEPRKRTEHAEVR